MKPPPRFSQLSEPRQRLIRSCQAANFGFIQNLLIRDREPVFDPAPQVYLDIKLDAEEWSREELGSADFTVCEEAVRLFALLDRIQGGKICKLEVRAGIPRRVLAEGSIAEWSELSPRSIVAEQNLPAARQAGSKGPVRRRVVESERETAAEKAAGHRRDARGGRGSEDASRREYPETTRVGDCLGS